MAKYDKPLLDLEGSINAGDMPWVDRGTIFVEDDLGISGRPPMSAIYVPGVFMPTPNVDVLLYLHGHGQSSSIQSYLRSYKLREIVEDSGKHIVFIAPTLGRNSEAGALVMQGVIHTYLKEMMGFLHDYGPYNATDPIPKVRTIVLAAHSGGGMPMSNIAFHIANSTNNNPECWGFDCLYDEGIPVAAPAPYTIKDGGHPTAKDQQSWQAALLDAVEGYWVKWSQGGRTFKAFYGGGGTLTRTANLQLAALQKNAFRISVEPSLYDQFEDIKPKKPLPHPVSSHDNVPKTVLGRCLAQTTAFR